MTPRLLFFSNLFPTASEPYRGLDNAVLLHSLAPHFDVRVLSPRPRLPWDGTTYSPRPEDTSLHPRWVPAAYLPKIGSAINHRLMAASLRHAFEQTLRDFQPAVILGSWIYPDSCAALHLARGRLPVVAIAQGSDIHQYLNMPVRRRIILKDLPGAKAVITRSRELSRILESTGFPSDKLNTVYNGVSLETFRPRPALASRKPGRVILFVGNFYPVKNPLLLIQAVAQMDSTLLIMAGAGPLERSARDLATQLGVPSRIVFAGRKTPLEIAELMNGADLLAVPSTNEGVPNVILEAFASSLPVVASNVGGIPEVLDQPFLGRMFPSEDLPALVTALNGQLAAPRDSAAIRRHAERFSWVASASAYREILMDILQ